MEAINAEYLERRSFACLSYSTPAADGEEQTDEEIFNEYLIERDECAVATFRITPVEIQVLHDGLALMTKSYDDLWAAYDNLRRRHYDLQDILKQIAGLDEKQR